MKIAVIPARGGSKRIPRKNLKVFCGKPIIAWSIETAIRSGLFDHIIVSTDDAEISDVAKKYGAEVPFIRPNSLSDDFVGTGDVVKHAVEWFIKYKQPPEYICEIYPTAPFVQESDLLSSFQLLKEEKVEMAFSVTSYAFPVQRALKLTQKGRVEMLQPKYLKTRSQELEEIYHDAGQFYWFTTKAILKQLAIFSVNSVPYILPRYRVQDIDTEEDWMQAELMFTSLNVRE